MIRSTTQTPMPEQVLRQVQQVQKTKQSRDRRYAWLVGATVLAFAMLIAMIVEAQLNLFSHALRFGLTLLSLAATAVCTWTLWRRGKEENERLVSAAKDVDEAYPALEERVSTLTSCEENRWETKQLPHPAMLNRLTEETTKIHQRVESKTIVSHRMLRRPLAWLAAAAAIMFGMLVWDAPKTVVQFGRFWAPWANLSTTKVTAVEADSVVARNEPVKLTATLSGRRVDEVEFFSRSIESDERSTTRIWPSTKDESVAKFRQAKAIESFDYRFRAGDGQTEWHRVTVADRPKIEELTMQIIPPEYTGKQTQRFRKLPKKLRVVAGSRLEMTVKPKADVRTARLVMGKTDWLSMEPNAEGEYDCSFELRQPIKFEVQLTELHGLQNRRPPGCFLQVVADQAPKVKILKPTKTAVLLPDETIDIHFKATDDHGIQKMALRVYTQRENEDVPTVHEVAIPIDSASNSKKIKGSVALDLAQFDLKDGDTIRYEIRASDNFRPSDVEEQSELQPIEGVEMVQAEAPDGTVLGSNAQPVQNDASLKSVSEGSTPSPQSTQTSSQPVSDVALQNNGSSNAQGDVPKDPPESESPEPETRVAEAPATRSDSGERSTSNATIASPDAAVAQADQEINVDESSKAPSEKVADTNKQESPAANENLIQSATPEEQASSSTPETEKITKSDSKLDSSTKQVASNTRATSARPSSSSNSNQSASDTQQASSSSSSQSSSSSGSSSQSKMAAKEQPKSDIEMPKSDQDLVQPKSDPVQMATRSLDVGGQSSSSGQQQIKVDQYAGGFTSDHRYKLELAISPTLELLKESLKTAGKDVRRVMNPTTDDPATGADAEEALSRSSEALKLGSEAVIQLNQKTRNTPYAFVGLRLESIRTADVAPAWDDVRKAIDAEGEPRVKHAGNAWNHINRALASLAKLEEKYEQVKRDLKRADDILKFKKMHRVFIENSLAMLNPRNFSINGQNRKGAEFDLDEEYLKRLKEVLEMRQDMMAELARILADDPQLLRRYMNRMNERNWSIRDQLTLIANEQQGLAMKVQSWAQASKEPLKLVDHNVDAVELHLSEIQELANRVADLQDEFVSWLPLEDDVEKGDVAKTVASFKVAGSALTQIVADVEEIFLEGGLRPDFQRAIDPLLMQVTEVETALTKVSQSLQRIADNFSEPELANNATRRLPKMQSIRHDVQQWAGKLELLNDNLVHEVYSVDQENHRAELLRYSVKLASLESQLVAALQNREGQLPTEIADQSKELQKILDIEIPAAQLLASQTLLDGEATQAQRQQKDIVEKFELAENTFDEILQAIADELDKLPVEDPIASLLRDPTLDEILAQLESEQDFLEELGLSNRPSNLQIIGDFMNGSRGGMSSMLRQLMAQQQRMRNLSNLAYRNALARAQAKDKSGKTKPKLAKEDKRWNILVSQLGEDMLQGDNKIPPERYRSAIDQYFEQISKLKNGKESD